MHFKHRSELLPAGVDSEERLRDVVAHARMEEIDRRLQTAKGSPRLASWLRDRRQSILSAQISGNVSVSGSLYANKVYIPVQEFPDNNFVGLIIGPKGSTLKQLERITRSRIYVRGSYKDRYTEPLHCYITAETQENLQRATAVIENLVEESVFSGDGSRFRTAQMQAMNRLRTQAARALTDWEKFYRWWYFHNRLQTK